MLESISKESRSPMGTATRKIPCHRMTYSIGNKNTPKKKEWRELRLQVRRVEHCRASDVTTTSNAMIRLDFLASFRELQSARQLRLSCSNLAFGVWPSDSSVSPLATKKDENNSLMSPHCSGAHNRKDEKLHHEQFFFTSIR